MDAEIGAVEFFLVAQADAYQQTDAVVHQQATEHGDGDAGESTQQLAVATSG